MVEPIKPVSAVRAAQMAANSKAYRVRVAAAKHGVDVPAQFVLKREAMYRPPRAAPGASPAKLLHLKKVAAYQARQGAAERASTKASSQRDALATALRKIPQANNPKSSIFMSAPVDRRLAPGADAKTILTRAAAARLQPSGKKLRREFESGLYPSVTQLSPAERIRFREALERVAQASPQALAIYFHHEGGSSEFGSIIAGLSQSTPDASSTTDALDRLDILADRVGAAEGIYGESALGVLKL